MAEDTLRSNQRYASGGSGYNAISFMIERFLKDSINTAIPVKVTKVMPRGEESGSGGGEGDDEDFPQPAPVGYVQAIPLVCSYESGMGAEKKRLQPTTIPKLPYCRLQGGEGALVCDPKIGDVGLAVFAQQDISRLFNADQDDNTVGGGGSEGNGDASEQEAEPVLPGSFRTFDMSDGIYIGGILNKKPKAWVEFTGEGDDLTLRILAPKDVKIKAGEKALLKCKNLEIKAEEDVKIETKNVEIKADKVNIEADKTSMSGDLEVKGTITGGKVQDQGGIVLGSHRHTNGNDGHPTGGPF